MNFRTYETNRHTRRPWSAFAAVSTLLASITFGVVPASSADKTQPSAVRSNKANPKTLPRGLSDLPLLFRGKEIVRTTVVGRKGNMLGQVEELVVDARTGAVRYAALEVSPLFGRDKLFAVPWDGLQLHRGERGLDLRFDIERK